MEYKPGDACKFNDNITLYAKWGILLCSNGLLNSNYASGWTKSGWQNCYITSTNNTYKAYSDRSHYGSYSDGYFYINNVIDFSNYSKLKITWQIDILQSSAVFGIITDANKFNTYQTNISNCVAAFDIKYSGIREGIVVENGIDLTDYNKSGYVTVYIANTETFIHEIWLEE